MLLQISFQLQLFLLSILQFSISSEKNVSVLRCNSKKQNVKMRTPAIQSLYVDSHPHTQTQTHTLSTNIQYKTHACIFSTHASTGQNEATLLLKTASLCLICWLHFS